MRLVTRLAMAGRHWRQWVPIVPALTDYQSDDFSQDLIAGAVVGMVNVPQAIAYAYLAGLPPQAGLYASLVAYVDLRRFWQFKASRCRPSSRRRSAGGFRNRTARAELR